MRFDLCLFSTDTADIAAAVGSGVDAIVVDWETRGKVERQAGADTEINADSLDDLRRVRAATRATVICRINAVGPTTVEEVAGAAREGADEILVPMVRTPGDVERVLALAPAGVRVGILIETVDAVAEAAMLAGLPLSRVYVGLNDLAIERRSSSIFAALADGTIDRLRPLFPMPFGFGGLTLPERGCPIPCRLLIGEMARLECGFSFLRRSYKRDMRGRVPQAEIPRLRAALEQARRRSRGEVIADTRALHECVTAPAGRTAKGACA